MNPIRPVEILWKIIALNEPISISTFFYSDLDVYYQATFRPKATSKLSKNKSKATSSIGQNAGRPGPSGSRSWEKDVEIVEKYWGVLPWDDTDDNFLLAATQCNASLATLGNLEGPQKYKDESQQSFNLRGLHTFLWLWKVIEKENEKRGEPFDKEDEDKIKDNMADQYKDAKRRQQGSGKRKSGGSSRQHLARSDKKEKILDESAACVFIMESRPSCRRRSDVVDDLGLSFKR
ncbi:hypothetical protein IWX90DRAFT_498487 [Phyllosticta citrichinensis]|uniref:Uncharacterized protein n=1 Tax=Phyllosticta citrichinensis TaxID=1130410 RepID=A0ABR1Y446_9PEZI